MAKIHHFLISPSDCVVIHSWSCYVCTVDINIAIMSLSPKCNCLFKLQYVCHKDTYSVGTRVHIRMCLCVLVYVCTCTHTCAVHCMCVNCILFTTV